MNGIAVDLNNFAEVAGAYGILIMDYLTKHNITKSRFTESRKLVLGADGNFRSGMFEFDHPDFAEFVRTCAEMKLSALDDGSVSIAEALVVDWFANSRIFIGDTGNFSSADKLNVLLDHQQVLEKVPVDNNFFTHPVSLRKTNYIANYNSHKKGFQDAGGVYEKEDEFFASEWFLIVALQCLRHSIERWLPMYQIRYAIHTGWLPFNAALAGFVNGQRTYKATMRSFGKGKVLRSAWEIQTDEKATSASAAG